MSFSFFLTALAIALLPGTGAILTITAGLVHGRRASAVTALGCTLGVVPHLVAAVSGAAVLLRASGLAFEALKAAGVAYLLVLAVLTWRDRTPILLSRSQAAPSVQGTVANAVFANLLNPKLTLFFFAFLPQFVPAGGSQVPRMLELGGVFMIVTLGVFLVYGMAASVVRRHLVEKPAAVRRLRQLFAVSFVGLGVRVATESR